MGVSPLLQNHGDNTVHTISSGSTASIHMPHRYVGMTLTLTSMQIHLYMSVLVLICNVRAGASGFFGAMDTNAMPSETAAGPL